MPDTSAAEAPPPDLASATVLDLSGAVVKLGSTFADGPAVLVFLRHFG